MERFTRISLLLVLLGAVGQAVALPIITLDPQSKKIHPGENLFVDINVSGLQSGGSNSLLGAFSLDVVFDPALNFLASGSGANTFGNGLGDVNAGEALVGADPWVPGIGKFSFYEVSLLDTTALAGLQSDSFRLATLAFYLPYVTTPYGSTMNFSTANVVLSDDLGNQLATGVNQGATVRVSEPPAILMIIGLFTLVNIKKIRKLIYRFIGSFVMLGLAMQVQASNSMVVLGEIGNTDSDNAILSYNEKGVFDRILVFESHNFPGHIAIGPDGNLFEDGQSSIKSRSLMTGQIIDTFINLNDTFGYNWCFGPDGNLYLLKPQDQNQPYPSFPPYSIKRVGGPLLPNAKQLDPDFEVIFTEYIGAFNGLYKMEFGPDITGDGQKELYILIEGRLIAYNGYSLMQNQALIEVARINEGEGLRNFAIGNDNSFYVWHQFRKTVNRYIFNPITTSFNGSGTFIADIGNVKAMSFGPDANSDGISDMYLGLNTFNPWAPIVTAVLYDGKTGSKIKNLIQTNGGSVHSISDIIFGPRVPPKEFNVFSLNYGVNWQGDTYVRTDLDVRRNDNYGLQDFIEIGTGRGGDGKPAGSADAMRGLIFSFGKGDFNLSELPNEPISSAILEMTVMDFPNGTNEVYQIDIHRISDYGSAPYGYGREGNGYEGVGGPIGSTDPDSAEGVAWAGADINTDPFAANNFTNSNFDSEIIASAIIKQNQTAPGSVIRWDVTKYIQSKGFGGGIMLRDVTTSGFFRGIRLYSKDTPIEAYRPRLLIGYGSGNLDGDNDVDKNDLAVITKALNTPAYGSQDSKDLNKDGFINILDARILVIRCTRPLCAIN